MVKLDLTPLLKHETNALSFEFDFEEPEIEYVGETIIFEEPIKVQGSAKRIADQLFLEMDIFANLTTQCARCLQAVSRPIAVKCFDELLPISKEKDIDQDENVFFYESHSIDLYSYSRELVMVNIPLKTVCKDDCEGICTKCGRNLNEGMCECGDEEVEVENLDPRLAQLRDWFHNAKE